MSILIIFVVYGIYATGAIAMFAVNGEFTTELVVYLIVSGFLSALAIMFGIRAEKDGSALFVMRVEKAAAAQELIDVKIDASREAAHIDVTREEGDKIVTIPVALKLVFGGDGTIPLVVSAAPAAGPATMEQIRGLAQAEV